MVSWSDLLFTPGGGCGIVLQYDATSPLQTTQLQTVESPEYLGRLAENVSLTDLQALNAI